MDNKTFRNLLRKKKENMLHGKPQQHNLSSEDVVSISLLALETVLKENGLELSDVDDPISSTEGVESCHCQKCIRWKTSIGYHFQKNS